MSIALISSLYRCEKHLPTYTAAVFGFAKQISQCGISVHYLPIVNDASDLEREQLNTLAQVINSNYFGRMTPRYVARESLYASWNRGIALAQTAYFASWNADDIRSADAFVEGYRALQEGANLVDFPFTRVSNARHLGVFERESRHEVPLLFHAERFTRNNSLGPFFMASKSLYQRVGAFDEAFRVAGDMEWAGRAQQLARFHAMQHNGGDFLIHGENLSNSGGDREDIEVNIIFMRRGEWQQLRPAHPSAQRDAWESWGNNGEITLPPDVVDFLWGPAAMRRWQQVKQERKQGPLRRRIRLALASRGFIRSAEWSEYERSRPRRRGNR